MKYTRLILLSVLTFLSACNGTVDNTNNNGVLDTLLPRPPESPSAEEYCDSLRARTYQRLNSGEVEMITDDFPMDDINRRLLFEEILAKKFKMKLVPIFDKKFYPLCIIPVMDSVIIAKYGKNGKDSIINLIKLEMGG